MVQSRVISGQTIETKTSFWDIIKPWKEVLTGAGLSGIVDLENFRDGSGKRLEARPVDLLDMTSPTSDARFVIQNLHERFSSQGRTAGLYLFGGCKSSGKSHHLLLFHHVASDKAVSHGDDRALDCFGKEVEP